MKILALGAHPDDLEIYMFGLLSCFAKNKEDLVIVVATDGAAGTIKENRNLADIRKKEAVRGLANLANPVFLNMPDGQLSFNTSYFQKVKKFVDKVDPDLVVTHSPEDYHPDHRALSNYVVESVGFKAPIIFADTLMGVNFIPEIYIDITEHFENKKRAIMCHKSQNPEKFRDAVTLLNRFRSAQCNKIENNFAECYRPFKSFPYSDVSYLLPNRIKISPYYEMNKNSFL